MVERIAQNVVEQLIMERIIEKEEQEVYQYALVMLLEKTITVVSLLLIGYRKRIIFPTVLFMIFFFSLRKRTGGYHAKRFVTCYTLTMLTFYLLTEYSVYLLRYPVAIRCSTFVSIILIWTIGTVNHPNMHMNREEVLESKKSARYIVILEGICIVLFEFAHINSVCTEYMSLAVLMCAFLLSLAKLLRQEVCES